MKKLMPAIFVIIMPYSIPLSLYIMLNRYISTVIPDSYELLLLALPVICYMLGIINTIVIIVRSFRGNKDVEDVVKLNMLIKLIHIPAYVLIFFMGAVTMITIFTSVLSLVFVFLDMITIICTGAIGLSSAMKCKRAGLISGLRALVYGIIQFIFCIDIVSAVMLYMNIKKKDILSVSNDSENM